MQEYMHTVYEPSLRHGTQTEREREREQQDCRSDGTTGAFLKTIADTLYDQSVELTWSSSQTSTKTKPVCNKGFADGGHLNQRGMTLLVQNTTCIVLQVFQQAL